MFGERPKRGIVADWPRIVRDWARKPKKGKGGSVADNVISWRTIGNKNGKAIGDGRLGSGV